jgi:hypothetical protein
MENDLHAFNSKENELRRPEINFSKHYWKLINSIKNNLMEVKYFWIVED